MSTSQSSSHNGSRQRSPRRSGRRNRRPSSPTPKKPKSLLSKILGIFGIGTAAKAPSGKVTRETVRRSPDARSGASSASQTEPRERKSRPVERIEVTSPRLYVGNLSYDAKEDDLEAVFSGVGTVVEVEISFNSRTQRSKGFAFIEMASIDEARRAVEELHDKELMGRKMLVSGAKPKTD